MMSLSRIEWQLQRKVAGAPAPLLALALSLLFVAFGVVLNLRASSRFLAQPNLSARSLPQCPDCTSVAASIKGQLTRASLLEAPADFWPHKNISLDQLPARYPHVIKRMCIIGERNSGTNWLEATLNLNFQTGQLPHRFGLARTNCFRHKHWFHFSDIIDPLVEDGDLIFVIFRNVVDWLLHFSEKPHHSYSHADISFEEFLQRPWAAVDGSDACASQVMKENAQGDGGSYYEEYRLVFGGPYAEGPIKDVLQLRAMKIDNFLRIPHWVKNGHQRVIFIRYEDLIDNAGQGFRDFLDEVKARFDINSLCRTNGSVPAPVSTRYKMLMKKQTNLTALEMQQVHYNKSIIGTSFEKAEALQLLLEGNVDFELEKQLGYTYDYLRKA